MAQSGHTSSLEYEEREGKRTRGRRRREYKREGERRDGGRKRIKKRMKRMRENEQDHKNGENQIPSPLLTAKAIASSLELNVRVMLDKGSALWEE